MCILEVTTPSSQYVKKKKKKTKQSEKQTTFLQSPGEVNSEITGQNTTPKLERHLVCERHCQRIERQSIYWEKILANIIPDKRLYIV